MCAARRADVYGALKRRFGLTDDDLADLHDELIAAKQLARDEDGRVLVWTGGSPPPPAPPSTPSQLPADTAHGQGAQSQTHLDYAIRPRG